MRTELRSLTVLLHPLRGYVDRVTERADAAARAAGLIVELAPGGVRRYRDPRFDQPDQLAARHETGPYADVRTSDDPAAAEAGDAAWSTPVLTVSACMAGAGWSR